MPESSCDVAVVGGGVMGCAVARALAREGLDVVVLERAVPGAEASSAAAGILGAQLECAAPGPFFELCVLSRMRWQQFAREIEAESDVAIGYRAGGALELACTAHELTALEKRVAWQSRAGARAELLDPRGLAALDAGLSPDALAAAHFPDDGQVDAQRLARALAIAAERAGARFVTGALVRGITQRRGRAIGVDLDGGSLRAGAVVVAAGSWTALVPGAGLAALPIAPARGQMVELSLRKPLSPRVVGGHGGYVVPRSDGRVLAGSTMEHVGFVKEVTAAGLGHVLGIAMQLVPALGEAAVLSHWAGFRPWTADGLPILGDGPIPGLFLAAGHFRNGILLAPITADVLCARLCDEPGPVDLAPFSWRRFANARRTPPRAISKRHTPRRTPAPRPT